MGDEGSMDPCECIWSHELAMRRLLNVIRNSQATCTDNECFEDGFRNQNSEINSLVLTVFAVVALFFFYFRPRTQRGIADDPAKPANGSDGSPPNPPPTIF